MRYFYILLSVISQKKTSINSSTISTVTVTAWQWVDTCLFLFTNCPCAMRPVVSCLSLVTSLWRRPVHRASSPWPGNRSAAAGRTASLSSNEESMVELRSWRIWKRKEQSLNFLKKMLVMLTWELLIDTTGSRSANT